MASIAASDVVHVSEAEQTLARRQELAEAGLLRDDGSAGGEVAGAAVAEPARAWPDILVARHGEFGARLLYVGAVAFGVVGDTDRVLGVPPVLAEALLHSHALAFVQLQGQFEASPSAAR